MTIPTIGEYYTHYHRGGRYEIIHIGYLQSDTPDDGKQVIIYKQLHDTPDYAAGTVWVRTVEMFMSMVEFEGTQVPRFIQL